MIVHSRRIDTMTCGIILPDCRMAAERRSSEQLVNDPITYPLLQQIQAALGYAVADVTPLA
jgi:hypothetical protein